MLAVAHAEGIAHRDLKPDNLMLIADSIAPSWERVKVLDFGIAKLTSEQAGSVAKTDTQTVMGTPLYMSPEQCAGAGGVTAKADVYSLGCVLYEALAGRPPFIAEGGGHVLDVYLFKEPPPLSEHAPRLSPTVDALVHRMLTKDKVQRPSISEAADELGRLLGKLYGAGPAARSQLLARTDSDGPSAPRAIGTTLGGSTGQRNQAVRRRGRLGAIVAATVLITASATLAFRGLFEPRPPPAQLPAPASSAVAPTPKTESPAAPRVNTHPARVDTRSRRVLVVIVRATAASPCRYPARFCAQ